MMFGPTTESRPFLPTLVAMSLFLIFADSDQRNFCPKELFALDGGTSGLRVSRPTGEHAQFFTGNYEHRELSLAGHNLPQEAPREFADAILSLI
jgi:hypothetical protein